MLTEDRYSEILACVERDGSVTVQQLMLALDASESTIRRDLNSLDKKGLLTKVHGGAISNHPRISTMDEAVIHRKALHQEEKVIIAKYAASLIEPDDFVYLDAGTSTELIIDFLKTNQATFVTNATGHAKKLAEAGCRVYVLGGEFKSSTEAIVGEEAVFSLDKYNFTKGFFGTNGVNEVNGFTTPELKEAMVKQKAMKNCKERYVLTDCSKFLKISSVKFSEFENAIILTNELQNPELKKYKHMTNVKEVRGE